MRTRRIVRGVLPWLAGWLALQGVLALVGRLLARHLNEGDESTAGIRRLQVVGGLDLHPVNPALCRVRMDLVMAGAELDLTGIGETSGIDLTVNALMGGVGVRVPADWRVWSKFRGIGGLGTDHCVQRTHDEHTADLRVHGTALFGGIGVEAG
jgi:hypothetical protein